MARPPKPLLDPDRIARATAASAADSVVRGRRDKASQDKAHAVFKAKMLEWYGIEYPDTVQGRARARKDHQRARDRFKAPVIYSTAGTGPEQLQRALDLYVKPAKTAQDSGLAVEGMLRRMIESVREYRSDASWRLAGDEGRSLLRVLAANVPTDSAYRAQYLGGVKRVCRDETLGDLALWFAECPAAKRLR